METVAYFPMSLIKDAIRLQLKNRYYDYEHGFNSRSISVYSSSPEMSYMHCGSKPLNSVSWIKAIGRSNFSRHCYIDCDGGQVWPA